MTPGTTPRHLLCLVGGPDMQRDLEVGLVAFGLLGCPLDVRIVVDLPGAPSSGLRPCTTVEYPSTSGPTWCGAWELRALSAELGAIDLFVASSSVGDLSSEPLIAALAAGVAVVATDHPAYLPMREQGATIVPAGATDRLARTMAAVLTTTSA